MGVLRLIVQPLAMPETSCDWLIVVHLCVNTVFLFLNLPPHFG